MIKDTFVGDCMFFQSKEPLYRWIGVSVWLMIIATVLKIVFT